jgi:hypothetical protein
MIELERYLDDLEARIDPAVEAQLQQEWETFTFTGWKASPLFRPARPVPVPPRIAWPTVRVNETLDDTEAGFTKMALQQLRMCSDQLATGGGRLLDVRANYGTGILASVLGAPVHVMDDVYNTLPTARPVRGGEAELRAIADAGVPDITTGQGARVLEMGRRFRRLLDSRPKLSRFVHPYHPDLQGPLDIAELLWGSDIFVAFFDQSDLVKAVVARVTDTYIALIDAWFEIVRHPMDRPWSTHWGQMHRGHIFLRLDSGMNISAEMYREFGRDADARLLARYGGALHSCGRVDHFFPVVAEIPGLYALNLSQPEYNDMASIYACTIDRGVRLLGHPHQECDRIAAAGRPTHGLVHSN